MKNTFVNNFSIKSKSFEFINIPLENDIEVFICPFLIENTKLEENISLKIYERLVNFLTKLNREFVKPNKKNIGLSFLSHLHEPNEIHFGYSNANKGKAVAKEKAAIIFDALRNNRFAKQGLQTTNEAHNILLLVRGIGQDIMSDIILNVCRDIFSEFTIKQIKKYKIRKTKSFNCEYYNSKSEKWETKDFVLPVYNNKRIILVPRKIVSGKRSYSTRYNWFVAKNHIAVEIMNRKTKKDERFFEKRKNGTKQIIIKRIYNAYKKPKEELIQFVLYYKGSLDGFIRYAKEHYPEVDLSDLN